MVIAKADCTDKAKKTCEKLGVQGYPAIKYMLGEEQLEYEGSVAPDVGAVRLCHTNVVCVCVSASRGS